MSPMNELFPDYETLKDAKILVVDNDVDSSYLCSILFEVYGAQVSTIGSVKDALDLLDWFIPNILICEIRFLGESVYPLIKRVRHIALSNGQTIPVLVTSTCSLSGLAQYVTNQVEAYLLKPIDINDFVDVVRRLVSSSRITYSSNFSYFLKQQSDSSKRLLSDASSRRGY